MLKLLFYVVAAYFAVIGFAQTCVSFGRWFSGSGKLTDSFLLMVVRRRDPNLEGALRQAHTEIGANSNLRGVRMLVLTEQDLDEESKSVCRCFCRETGVSLLEAPSPLLRELDQEP